MIQPRWKFLEILDRCWGKFLGLNSLITLLASVMAAAQSQLASHFLPPSQAERLVITRMNMSFFCYSHPDKVCKDCPNYTAFERYQVKGNLPRLDTQKKWRRQELAEILGFPFVFPIFSKLLHGVWRLCRYISFPTPSPPPFHFTLCARFITFLISCIHTHTPDTHTSAIHFCVTVP